jgi:hypothetical protein
MAESKIKKSEAFSSYASITSFPYTPTNSGICTLFVIGGKTNGNLTIRAFNITDTTEDKIFYFRTITKVDWDAASVVFPMIKGHTYTISEDDSGQIDYSRSFLIY